MATATQQKNVTSANVFRQKIKSAYKQVKSFIEQRGNKRLAARWQDWDHRFQEIYKQSNQQPEVEISLVGGTGAGKSTLLNALIGERVLPISNMKACTAAISEVGYCSDSYKAKVEFLSRDEWEKEVSLLRADISDSLKTVINSLSEQCPVLQLIAFGLSTVKVMIRQKMVSIVFR